MPERIVVGQNVDPLKAGLAKGLRRQMTAEERLLWHHLRGNRLGGFHFRRQQVIDGFIADFYCYAARLVVEVDGAVHAERIAYDEERDAILSARGLRVLRIENGRVREGIEEVLALILQMARCRPLPCPLPGAGRGTQHLGLAQKQVPPSRVGKGDRGLGPS